jgi:RNA polymerase sigma-70 factor (ECF subfamily)
LPDESALALVRRLVGSATSPSEHLLRQELRRRLRDALERLGERDREVLLLRYLEGLSTRETAAVLGITEGAVKVRHLRALERLRGLLGDDFAEGHS